MKRDIGTAVVLAGAVLACGVWQAQGQTKSPPEKLYEIPQPHVIEVASVRRMPEKSDRKRNWHWFFAYPPLPDALRKMHPPSPSWIAWWEANRDPYLEAVHQTNGRAPDPNALAEYRRQATKALRLALASKFPQLRASAAFALGQMGDDASLTPLSKSAKTDKSLSVRQAAIIAIGLLDIPDGEKVLAEIAFQPLPRYENNYRDRPNDRQAALVALGLMSRLSPETIAKLKKFATGSTHRIGYECFKGYSKRVYPPLTAHSISAWTLTRPIDPKDHTIRQKIQLDLNVNVGKGGKIEACAIGSSLAASAISTWILSFHEDPNNPQLFRRSITRTTVPWIANEAMLALGSCGDPNDVRPFAEVLLAAPKGRSLPVFRMLSDQHKRLMELWRVYRTDVVQEDVLKCAETERYDKKSVGLHAYRRAGWAIFWKSGRKTMAPNGQTVTEVLSIYQQLHFGGNDCDAVYDPKPHFDTSPFRKVRPTIYEFSWLHLYHLQLNGNPWGDIYRFNFGVEPIVDAHLRASAAIALGRIDCDDSRKALQKLFERAEQRPGDQPEEPDDDYSDIYKSAAIMSLAKLGGGVALPARTRVRATLSAKGEESQEQILSPLYGFSILARGVYSCNAVAARSLASGMVNADEPQETRAACALALGLSGQKDNLKYLRAADKTVGQRDDLLIGYIILARGMLGDATVLKPAERFLDPNNNRTDTYGILGRRAAVMGVGLTGSPEALPALTNGWELGHYVCLETARAQAYCGEFAVTKKLVAELAVTTEPESRVPADIARRCLAARCLGELFTKKRPARLNRLIDGGNYLMPIPRLSLYRSMANEFLYQYLLPPVPADRWEPLVIYKIVPK